MQQENVISLDEALYYLMATERHDLADGTFWYRDGEVVGRVDNDNSTVKIDDREQLFMNDEAQRLMKIGQVISPS